MSTGTGSGGTGSGGTGSGGSSSGGFFKGINDGEAGQLLALASNSFGVLQGVLTILQLAGVTLPGNDTGKILDAINQLQQQLNEDFVELGDLIRQQIQLVVDTTNRDSMALALAQSDAGLIRTQEFLTTKDAQALESAETESVIGLHFFTELGLDSPDLPFFMPGLVKAGTIRIFVLGSEPADFRVPAIVQSDLQAMTSFLSTMIAEVTSTVTGAHTVVEKNHVAHTPPGGGPILPNEDVFIIDGFFHEERGVPLAFFACDRDPASPLVPTSSLAVEQALGLAKQASLQGISNELAFLGIPQYQQVLNAWNTLLAQVSPVGVGLPVS